MAKGSPSRSVSNALTQGQRKKQHYVGRDWNKLLKLLVADVKHLGESKKHSESEKNRYEEHDYNCYTYALAFINSVLAAQGKQQMSKSEFTEKFVIPQTKKASKYITLHQELTANEFYVVPLPDQEKRC